MYFRCKMKPDFRVIIPFCIQEPFGLRQVNQVAIFIFGYIRLFETDKLIAILFR